MFEHVKTRTQLESDVRHAQACLTEAGSELANAELGVVDAEREITHAEDTLALASAALDECPPWT